MIYGHSQQIILSAQNGSTFAFYNIITNSMVHLMKKFQFSTADIQAIDSDSETHFNLIKKKKYWMARGFCINNKLLDKCISYFEVMSKEIRGYVILQVVIN